MALPTGPDRLLLRVPFLHGAPPVAVERLAARARWITAAPGQAVLDHGDATTDVFFVVQGAVRVLVRTADGLHARILGDFGEGELVGELAAIDPAPRSARVEALVHTRLCAVPAAAFLELVFSSREVAARLLALLTRRIRAQTRLLLEDASLPIRLRLVAELLRLSRDRPDGTRALSPPPTGEELGERIGARREAVSRELAGLIRAGLLRRTRGALALLDPAALAAMVDAALDGDRD